MTKTGLILRGMAMGIAEVIPGVSGGTIAFITGIYKTLIDTIKSVNPDLIKSALTFKFNKVWEGLNGPFLLWLLTGMVGGILIGVFGVSYLLESAPEILWAFFFGLILASVPYMLSQLERVDMPAIVLFVLGAIIAYGITSLAPTEGSDSYLYVFGAGAIAISALVLPGISGSFILLLMGLYTTIIPTLKSFLTAPGYDDFVFLAVFGLGCLTGLMVFSRLISAAFERYYNPTIALLSGFMLGSLNKIWPWRNPEVILSKDTGRLVDVNDSNMHNYNFLGDDIKIIQEANVLPAQYYADDKMLLAIVAFILGMLMVLFLSRFGNKGFQE